MIVNIFLVILSGALIIYCITLNVRLAKKNLIIETTVKRLSGIGKSLNMEEMMTILEDIQKSYKLNSFFPDKLLEKEITDFIFDNIKEMKIYMHYTRNEEDAKKILAEGFQFADSFHKTALPVSKDSLDLKIKHNTRKFFGDYLIIISISSDIVNFYSLELRKAGIRNYSFENLLTETSPASNENSDMMYRLPSQFIRGYINYRSGQIVKNLSFDPWYNLPGFMNNLNLLKSLEKPINTPE